MCQCEDLGFLGTVPVGQGVRVVAAWSMLSTMRLRGFTTQKMMILLLLQFMLYVNKFYMLGDPVHLQKKKILVGCNGGSWAS